MSEKDTIEIWKDVTGYEGLYQVSNLGKVRSVDRVVGSENGKKYRLKGKLLRKSNHTCGYETVMFSKKGKPKRMYVHRLVCTSFLTLVKGKEVNHKNGNKKDNRLSNLEWLTRSENLKHSIYEKIRIYKGKKIICLNNKKTYEKMVDAEKELNISSGNISKVCKGKSKQIKGYRFKYLSN